jgi:hypothetical protein
MRSFSVGAAIACLIGIVASAASAAEGFRPVFYIGQKVPGLDAMFAEGGNPIIGPNGEIGFTVRLLGPGVSPPNENGPTAYGAFLFNADGLTTLTYTGAAISGVDPPRRVEGLGIPQFSRTGYVTYDVTINNLETLQDRDWGVWDVSGPLLIGGQNGVPHFVQMYNLNQDRRSLFSVGFVRDVGGQGGIWEKRADGVFPLVLNVSVGPLQYDATTRDGNIIFNNAAGIYALEGSTVVPLSINGDPIGPGGPTARFPQLALLNAHDQLAIWGTITDEGSSKYAIWVREPDGTQRVIARTGEIPAGGTQPLPDPFLGGFNDQGKVLLAHPNYGLWIYGVDGSKQAIAIVDDNAPGIEGAHFVELEGSLNNRGSIAVQAYLSGEGITGQNNKALWFIDPDTQAWTLLLRSGQSIDAGDGQSHFVADFSLDGHLNEADQVVLFINFTDGGGAMYLIDAHEVPEPASMSLVGAVTLMLAGRRRR